MKDKALDATARAQLKEKTGEEHKEFASLPDAPAWCSCHGYPRRS